MQIFFTGAESPAHLNTLKACGVERVAVNINNLSRHLKKFPGWASLERLGGIDWIVYADSPVVPVDPVLELLSDAAVKPELIAGPVSWAETSWIKDSDGFYPIWDGHDASILRQYVEDYEGVVLPDPVMDNPTAVRTARASLGRMGQLGGLTGRSKGVDRLDVLVSSAWWSVQKHGETQVWTGNRLVRLSSEDKHLKRQRYASDIEALGCDVGAVLADDPTESVKLAIRSWLALESHLGQVGPSVGGQLVASPSHQGNVIPLVPVASPTTVTRHQMALPNALQPLPIMGITTTTTTTTDAEGNETQETHKTIEVTGESMRQCNTCVLSAACPMFSPGSRCSYSIPIEIKTKDQRQAVMRALIEIQAQRILMGSFSEQVLGQADSQVGREMDRLFTMVEKWKNIEEQRPSLRINVEADENAANSGLISRLFGEAAGQNARMLDTPVLADDLIEEADLIDSE